MDQTQHGFEEDKRLPRSTGFPRVESFAASEKCIWITDPLVRGSEPDHTVGNKSARSSATPNPPRQFGPRLPPELSIQIFVFIGFLVPRRGLEPPRLAALLPESSASTNSAIWARGRRRGNKVGGGEGQRENVRIAAWPCLASHRTNGASTTGNKQSARATHRARPIDIHARRRRPPQPACAPCPRDIRST